jgi:hypothetical protein
MHWFSLPAGKAAWTAFLTQGQVHHRDIPVFFQGCLVDHYPGLAGAVQPTQNNQIGGSESTFL